MSPESGSTKRKPIIRSSGMAEREREREEGAWEEEEEEGSIVKKGDGRVVDGLFDKYTGILFAVVLLLAVLRSVTINVRRCARAV